MIKTKDQTKLKADLDQYSCDFGELKVYEDNSVIDLENVQNSDHWRPTDFERYYLPGLRLAGFKEKENVIIQNSADLHVHTQWSDGDDLEKVLQQALKMELEAIAITDHDEIEGALTARRIVHERRLPIAIIPGVEVSSKDGHIGALFVTKIIPKGLSAQKTVDLIHAAGGIAVAHHPYTPEWLEKILRVKLSCRDLIKTVSFDAIECTNAVPGKGIKYNIAAIEEMRNAYINVAVTGGSDAHSAIFVGKGRTYYAGNQGILSLRQSLEYGFTQGSENYWKTTEKFIYYYKLLKAIGRNLVRNW